MDQKVVYRFQIEPSQLTQRLRKHCDKFRTIWVEREVEDVLHVPQRGDRVSGTSLELRVFDRQSYVTKDHHSTLIECMMVESFDYDALMKGADTMVPRKEKVTKDHLRYCLTFGWTIEGIDTKYLT